MISQYIGKNDRETEERSICVNFLVMLLTGIAFFFLSTVFSLQFIKMFTDDVSVINEGSSYLGIIGWTFIPLGISNICGVAYLWCCHKMQRKILMAIICGFYVCDN